MLKNCANPNCGEVFETKGSGKYCSDSCAEKCRKKVACDASRRYRAKHPDVVRTIGRMTSSRYRAKHRDRILESRRRYCEKNKDKIQEHNRQRYRNRREFDAMVEQWAMGQMLRDAFEKMDEASYVGGAQ